MLGGDSLPGREGGFSQQLGRLVQGDVEVMPSRERAGEIPGVNHNFLDKPIWGARAIGEVIGRNPRQAFHLLTNGHIKSARQVGGRWMAVPSALLKEFGEVS